MNAGFNRRRIICAVATASLSVGLSAQAQHDQSSAPPEDAPTNSLIVRSMERAQAGPKTKEYHALRESSMFAVPPPRPREFVKHDLVQIIVRETSNVRSSQKVEAEKEYGIRGGISKWPSFNLSDLLQLQLKEGSGENTPELDVDFEKEFEGDGKYERRDDLTARLTAEVIDILPNGNLVLEARTSIKTDEEEATMKVTGICRPEDVTSINTVLSNQLHDLSIEKMHSGELKKTSEKGMIAKVLDAIFAF